MGEPSEREEAPERLKRIRAERAALNVMDVSANWLRQAYCEHVDSLLSLLDSQATTKPTGWISCGLRQGRDDRIVDIVFENADCAKAFIDGVEPTIGPIVAATWMRERCVARVKASLTYHDSRCLSVTAAHGPCDCGATRRREVLIRELASLTLDGEQEQ